MTLKYKITVSNTTLTTLLAATMTFEDLVHKKINKENVSAEEILKGLVTLAELDNAFNELANQLPTIIEAIKFLRTKKAA